MVTKEQCEKALNDYDLIKEFMLDLPSGLDGIELNCDSDELYDILNSLIEEHFSNPPLEWEELKECNVVYDKEQKKFRLIEDLLENGKRIVFTNTIDSFITENYEPNRFYRKEVKDVD